MMLQDRPGRQTSAPSTTTRGTMTKTLSFSDSPKMASPTTTDHETMRGRKRDRSMTRGHVRSVRCAPSDESSTLRGRSRHRATSASRSRATSPAVISPTSHRLLQARLRREHCPSRVTSPSGQQRTFRRRQRTRSRSRPRQLELMESSRSAGDAFSGLRNEVIAEPDESAAEKDEG